MNARTHTSLSLAALALVALAGCSSSPESLGSTSEALSPITISPVKIANPFPAPPVWPQASEPYCSSDPQCDWYAQPDPRMVTASPGLLASLGCTQAYGLEGTSDAPLGETFAVCFDSDAVASTFRPLAVTCDSCLPQLPAGQVYVFTGAPFAKPNCPDACPKGTVRGTGVGTIAGSKAE